MNYRNGLKALGLSLLAALGLMAFTAVGAQANGLFLILKDHTSGELLPTGWTNVPIKGVGEDLLKGNLLILKLNMEIFCHEAAASGTISENGTGLATITFKKCLAQGVTTDLTDTLIGDPCQIDDITAKVKALVILHKGNTKLSLEEHSKYKEGDAYILFVPDDVELLTFATVLNHTECPLPELAAIKGCAVAKIANPQSHLVQHLISTKGMLELFGCELKYGTHISHLNADALVELDGDHVGKLWGAT